MLLETHSHTREHSGCSHVGAVDLVRRVHRRELDGLVITDHHYLWPAEELRSLRASAGVPDNFVILSGQEATTCDVGDVLVLSAARSIPKGRSLYELAVQNPAAALVWAHPFRNGRRPPGEQLRHPLFDGVEIFSSNHSASENIRGLNAWHTHKFTALAGTDTHAESYAGSYPTLFDHPPESIGALAAEIKGGRCRPYFKEVVRSGSHLKATEITIGGGIGAALPDRIILKTFSGRLQWKSAHRTFQLMKTLYQEGFDRGRYRVAQPIEVDEEGMLLIEQGLQGVSFHERLIGASASDARYFTRLAARWLARLHNRRLQITPPAEFLAREPHYLAKYVKHFETARHPHLRRVGDIAEAVRSAESKLYRHSKMELFQGHGDYHPKNIYICQAGANSRDTVHVAVIDFDSSRCLPAAYDVGTFLAQFRNQFYGYPGVAAKAPEDVFLNAYLQASEVVGRGFLREVELFRARTNLNIAAYLVQLGLGDSENLWRVIVEAEKALVHFNA